MTHKASIDLAFREIGITSKAKTHAARGSGARMAELAGASEDQIRRLGRWNNQSMENCYLTNLPREAIRSLAGFAPAQGSYYLQRAAVDPSLALKQMIFPQIESALHKIKTGEYQETIAAKGFLILLDKLRTVVLQDSVVMKREHPSHPLWNHAIFSSEPYRIFEQDLQRSLQINNDPTEQRLQNAMPLLSQKIQDLHSDLKTTMINSVNPLAETVLKLQNNICDLLSGRVPVFINADYGSRPDQVPAITAAVADSNAEPSSPIAPEADAVAVARPSYRMSRGIRTVTDFWREWSEGLSGGPAVRDLELKYGTKWCEANERRFFNRRKKIADKIERLAAEMEGGKSRSNCIAAATTLEENRKRDGKSLDWLSKNLE